MKRRILLLLGFSVNLFATIINVPADSSTIQSAINGAVDGDTVIVHPGTYLEHISYMNKDITLGSLTLTTGDTAYISQTVIDAQSSPLSSTTVSIDSCIASLVGFKITGGSGILGGGINISNSTVVILDVIIQDNHCNGDSLVSDLLGGGLYIHNSSVQMENVCISDNVAARANTEGSSMGGGVYVNQSELTLENVIISRNVASSGGGVYCMTSDPQLTNVIIEDNGANSDGGIFFNLSNPILSNVTIRYNYTGDGSGGCRFIESSPVFDQINRCNIYGNWRWSFPLCIGIDLYYEGVNDLLVTLDTFTVLEPTDRYAFPLDHLTFDILHDINGLTVDVTSFHAPSDYKLFHNYPNPFNPSTTISYEIPEQSMVSLTIFDIRGQEVSTLGQSDKPPGNYEVQWNGLDKSGNPVSTGVYFCRLEAGEFSQTIKMLYLK